MRRLLPYALILAVILLATALYYTFLLGRGGAAAPPTQIAPQATAVSAATLAPATQPTEGGATPVPTLAPGMFVNPVLDADFPDPDVLKVGDTYYAYATNANGYRVQSVKSKDLVHWTSLHEALQRLPKWAAYREGLTWAPDVSLSGDGKTFVMYFVSRDLASDKQCIGAATSDKPEGAFAPVDEKPFICNPDEGGDIDPASFTDDDGTHYALWKNDGNCCNKPTRIYIAKAASDGLTLQGQPTALIENDRRWEGNVIEAPTLWKHNRKYYLFYSANNYAGAAYSVGYAIADSILGPYQKPDKPLLVTSSSQSATGLVLGPGGQDVVVAPNGQSWLLYHSWDAQLTHRSLDLDELTWNGDTPLVVGHRVPEPAPK